MRKRDSLVSTPSEQLKQQILEEAADDARNRQWVEKVYLPARAKLWIGSLDRPDLSVCAQYNPKELQIDKAVPWSEHQQRDNRSGPRRDAPPRKDGLPVPPQLEFNGAPSRSMTIELLFDRYEDFQASVEPDVRALEELSSVIAPDERKPNHRRPHHCVVAWGAGAGAMRPFRCVIESLAVKYTMWDSNGTPCRATCTIKVKEAQLDSASAGLVKTDEIKKRGIWKDMEAREDSRRARWAQAEQMEREERKNQK